MKSLKYKNVTLVPSTNRQYSKLWRAYIQFNYNRIVTYHETEREAALFVDLKRIEHGLEPINILKRK